MFWMVLQFGDWNLLGKSWKVYPIWLLFLGGNGFPAPTRVPLSDFSGVMSNSPDVQLDGFLLNSLLSSNISKAIR